MPACQNDQTNKITKGLLEKITKLEQVYIVFFVKIQELKMVEKKIKA